MSQLKMKVGLGMDCLGFFGCVCGGMLFLFYDTLVTDHTMIIIRETALRQRPFLPPTLHMGPMGTLLPSWYIVLPCID
jgi:hypothetical protein